jgi:very-short-patch-repair endonuclease|tara:strand:+ start:16252 stop:17025 length:774 start_codon:yes stop_codon:yes gene_type:complete
MKNIDEAYVIKNYTEGQSTISLAKELNTYPKKIERILKKNGQSLRSRSESQTLAIQNGRAKHPTKGLKRTEEEKAKISMGVEKAWKEMPEEAKEQFRQSAKNRWDNMSPEKRREMQEKAGRALRLACLEGSKQEKFLKNKLEEQGYDVVMHKKGLIEGKFEIDLLLPELNTIIEVDGPQHFLPLFGEDKLANTIKMDIIKNGLLISKGFCVIRIKYLCKNMNKSVERKLWDLVSTEVEAVKDKFPPKDKRFIELEIK